jgi:hypothetical protein
LDFRKTAFVPLSRMIFLEGSFEVLPEEAIQELVKLLDEIIGILTTSIGTMRRKRGEASTDAWGTVAVLFPSTPDPQSSHLPLSPKSMPFILS